MAIKERLLKQLQNVQDGLRAMPPFHSRDLQAMRNALLQARDLCFRGLSKNHFAEYKDTYDGLLLAAEQLAADAPDKEEIVSLCSELLQYMISQTQKETAFKKEIFFLPYKASMWDSLESVWKAADEDKEHCIAYVMPIPYADLTPEHTVAEWHCERELFPKDVPTVKWEDFDLQEIHPDVIFIHNPYDEYNRVTSVESRYYSSVLKDQTDKLVYIPYFVLEEIIPGNEAAEEAISGFILTPAVLNAHEVIVQSEDMRQVYINVLVRHTDQKDYAYWEKRILGLGSPKIEKVLTSKKEDFELPESWAKIVKGKKVILYNTSLSAMLQNSDKVCEKLRYVFDVFKHRDNVALWWRPHPLMKATIHSMRPEIEKEYCEIEKAYIEDGWGIFDDTSDLHRAITWSDVYYGDGSSVVQLYKATGKNIRIQEYNPDSREMAINVITHVAITQNHAWIVDSKTGILYQLNFHNKHLTAINNVGACYSAIGVCDNYLMIAPCFSSISDFSFKIIDLNGKKERNLEIEFPIVEYDLYKSQEPHVIHSCLEHNDKVYFLGWGYPFVIEVDKTTGKYFIHDAARLVSAYVKRKNFIHVFIHGTFAEDILFMPLVDTNVIVEFDTKTTRFALHHVGKETNQYLNIAYDGESIWLSQRVPGEAIVRWTPKTDQIEEYRQYPAGFDFSDCKRGYSGFIDMISIGDSILLFPDMANWVIEINKYTGKMQKNKWISALMKEKYFYDKESGIFNRFRFVTKIGNDIYAVLNDDNTLLKINYQSQSVEKYSLIVDFFDVIKDGPKTNIEYRNLELHGSKIYQAIC